MRPMIALITLGIVALGSAQVIEERSSIRNPDGSTTHNARSSFSQSSFSEEATGPDGTTVGRSVHRDTTGKITGNEWTAKNGQKVTTPKSETFRQLRTPNRLVCRSDGAEIASFELSSFVSFSLQ